MSAIPTLRAAGVAWLVAIAVSAHGKLVAQVLGRTTDQPVRPAVVFEVDLAGLSLRASAMHGCGTVEPTTGRTILIERDSAILIVLSPSGQVETRKDLLGQGHRQIMSCVFAGWRGSNLWVSDLRLSRVTVFDRDLQDGNSFLVPEGRFGNAYARALVGASDVLLEQSEPNRPTAASSPFILHITRTSLAGPRSNSDTLTRMEMRHGRLILRGEGVSYIGFQPWSDDPLMAVDPSGKVLVRVDRRISSQIMRSGTVLVTALDLRGRKLSQWRFAYRPVPLKSAIVHAVIGAKVRDFEWHPQLRDSAWAVKWIMERVYIPKSQPEVVQLFVGGDSSVWLRHTDREITPRDSAIWTASDIRGTPLATLVLPGGFYPLGAQGRLLTGVIMRSNRRLNAAVRYRF